ncbi:MAG TPA: sulfotransferase [Caulobacteraceae bacterium]
MQETSPSGRGDGGVEAVLDQALERHRSGALDEADRLYRAVLAAEPGQPAALRFLGFLEQERGRLPEARQLLAAALRARPDDAPAWSRLGVVHSGLGAPQDALDCYDRALALEARLTEAWNGRGNALIRLGRLEEALGSYDRTLALQPDHLPALANRGVALRDLGRASEAVASYERALEIRPDHVFTHNNKGVALMDLGRQADALASFERALELKSDYAEAWNNRGRALAQGRDPLEGLGRAPEALASFDRALALHPAYAEALDNKGVVLVELGRAEEAAAAFERAIRSAPHAVRYYYHLTQARRLQPADPHLGAMQAIARDPVGLTPQDRIELDFALGQALDEAGDAAAAFQRFADGNALRRTQIAYDEGQALKQLQAIRTTFTPELMAAKQGKGDPSALPVFIVGMPRSGATLVEQILASQSGVFAAGETAAFPQSVAAQPVAGGRQLQYPAGVSRLPAKALREIGARYVGQLAAAAPDALRVVDKRPDNFRFVGLIRLALPNAKIIVTKRDARDTCVSCFSKLFGAGAPYSFDLGELGRYHRAYEQLMEHWLQVLPADALLQVDYETLVADVDGESRRILAHCGLDPGPGRIDLRRGERRIRTASALQVRQPIYAASVGRWSRYEAFLRPLLEALGPISARR